MADPEEWPSHAEAYDMIGRRRPLREALLRVSEGERSEYCADLPITETPEEIRLRAFGLWHHRPKEARRG